MGVFLREDRAAKEFETLVLAHLDTAYNLARWLTRNDHDAEDLVQNAYLRAFRFRDSYRGGDIRVWLMTIVRNTYYTSLRDGKAMSADIGFDEDLHGDAEAANDDSAYAFNKDPAHALEDRDQRNMVNRALEKLPQVFKEVLVLKEMDDFSYKEIADVTGIPIGTVMSRLARARKLLLGLLRTEQQGDGHGM
ncbi:sigma-70 family RNA polymerase sigma factor [Undibacterium sp. CY18W]|uniref:Sigma-70 family RNA polymerase sigma factor n=1 Tax=Undibacterium hunanense TaxID=2762292 RepID=A0ABR6ZXT0_9BURK|nr:sigma-70 family RNA polymerase sigma factor [Undibacterium hunanense]MBC3920658.1 sigma-70 family RNA polymerase sigma factor [Undibacterium hunanense]